MAVLQDALWYVLQDAVLQIAGGLVAFQIIMAVVMLAIGSGKIERFMLLGSRGVLQHTPEFGQD